jgi:hypothetical protein
MSDRLKAVEELVNSLSEEELREFGEWFADLQDRIWESQIEQDALSGRLDHLVAAAREEHRLGRTREI